MVGNKCPPEQISGQLGIAQCADCERQQTFWQSYCVSYDRSSAATFDL